MEADAFHLKQVGLEVIIERWRSNLRGKKGVGFRKSEERQVDFGSPYVETAVDSFFPTMGIPWGNGEDRYGLFPHRAEWPLSIIIERKRASFWFWKRKAWCESWKKKTNKAIKEFFKAMKIVKGTESCRYSLSDRDWEKAAILNKRVKS